MPSPRSATVCCGFPVSLPATVSVARFGPADVASKTSCSVSDWPAATEAGRVGGATSRNWPASVPVIVRPEIESGPLPLLRTVTGLAALADPATKSLKINRDGVVAMVGVHPAAAIGRKSVIWPAPSSVT